MQVYLKRAVILFETFGNKDARRSSFKNMYICIYMYVLANS